MTWSKFGDDFPERLDIITLSDAAWRLNAEAIIWSNRFLTDGAIPARGPQFFAHPTSGTVDDAVTELVDAKVWEVTDDGWQLDWSDQERAADVEKRRADARARKDRFEDRRQRHNDGDHTACDPTRCRVLMAAKGNAGVRNGVRNGDADGSSIGKPADVTRSEQSSERRSEQHPLPSRPDPSRPDPKGGTGTEKGEEGRSGAGPASRSARATRSAGSPAARANRGVQVTAKARKPEQTHAGLTASDGPSSEDAPLDWIALHDAKAHPFSGDDDDGCQTCGRSRRHPWHSKTDHGQWGSAWRAEHGDDEGSPAA